MKCRLTLFKASGCCLILTVIGFISGCGDDSNPRLAVYGRVAGAEGRSGLVSFVPQESTQGPAARATLVNGEYQFGRNDGPVPGEYNVLIQLEILQDKTSGVVVFKGIEIPSDSSIKVPPTYKAVALLPVSVPTGSANSIQVDLELPET